MQIVISPFSGFGGFGEDLDPTLFEYTLKRQNAADQVPDWLTVNHQSVGAYFLSKGP